MTDELRDALARSAQRVSPSPAPVADILRSGRGRRGRRRGLTAAACLAAAAVALPLTGAISLGANSASGVQPAEMSSAAGAPGPGSHTFVLNKGHASGRAWWVLAVYYPVAPHGCSGLPGIPDPPLSSRKAGDPTPSSSGSGAAGAALTAPLPPQKGAGSAQPKAHPTPPQMYAVVTGVSTNGSTITQPFGCDAASIGWDPGPGGGGDRVVPDLPGSPRAFVGDAPKSVVLATMTLRDGTEAKDSVVSLPGAGITYYAFVVPDGLAKSLDLYDAHHHLVSHQNL